MLKCVNAINDPKLPKFKEKHEHKSLQKFYCKIYLLKICFFYFFIAD